MTKKGKTALHNQLLKIKKQTTASFTDKKINLSDKHLHLLSQYVGNAIYHVLPLPSRKLVVSVSNADDISIGLDQINRASNQITEVIYFLFLIQSSSGLYIIVASTFDMYSVLDREPYHESIGEYRYQARLAEALGLKHALAYDVFSPRNLSEDTVVKEDLELMHCGVDHLTLLIYRL